MVELAEQEGSLAIEEVTKLLFRQLMVFTLLSVVYLTINRKSNEFVDRHMHLPSAGHQLPTFFTLYIWLWLDFQLL